MNPVARALCRIPALAGRRISIRFEPGLTAHRGRLLSRERRGTEVHAASFLRKREIVLDAALLGTPGQLSRILVHELFHFVWLRLGNARRRSWEHLLAAELLAHARGELGWSSELRKTSLEPARNRRWREYAAESFCDTAACLYSTCRRHPEYTLAARFRDRRQRWFESELPDLLGV